MPPRRTRKPRAARKPRLALSRRLQMFNPSPVFTETYKLSSWVPNAGGNQAFSMDQVPQLAQYSNLYQKYRILKAKLMILPDFADQDQNAAEYNTATAYSSFGMGRLVWAVNDSPGLPPPASENSVLQDNGCKVLSLRHVNRISCKPVPESKDANNIQFTQRGKYITFASPNVSHYGITYWFSQPITGAAPVATNFLNVYVKLTFQVSDPR